MPQPPTITSPVPVPAPAYQIPASASTASAPQKMQMQVTGERKQDRPTPSAQSSVDAFGLPSSSAPKHQGSASSGFTDSFTTSKQFRPTSRFGRGLSQNHSGFGDSFDATATGNSAKSPVSPRVNVQAATPSATDIDKISPAQLEITQTTSPTPTGSRSATDDNANFESRYPSIDVLSGDDTSSTTPAHQNSNLISPVTSPNPPPNVSRPSMLGNMTGGDIKQPYQHLGIGGEQKPQPRSTHVTGTAFKQQPQPSVQSQSRPGQDQFTRSPSPIKAKKEYFETMSSNARPPSSPGRSGGRPPAPVDLMTGQENESMGAPLLQRQGSSMAPATEVT